MLRVWHTQSPMGLGHVWDMDMLGVLGQASWPGCSLVLRAIHIHGQVEGSGAGEDEGGWQSQGKAILRGATRLGRHDVHTTEVQHQGSCSVQGQGSYSNVFDLIYIVQNN